MMQAACIYDELSRGASQFTGKERDAETGLDYFGARYYGSTMGRWMSPDWSAQVEPVPYAKLDNPQSLNLYSYTLNNPLSKVDVDGHADVAAICKGQTTCHVTVNQTVNLYKYDRKTGKDVVYSTLNVSTKFTVDSNSQGKITSVSASSTVSNVSGYAFSNSQLSTMGANIGMIQQGGVGLGLGANTTELLTSIATKETLMGAAAPAPGEPAFKNPAINPLQLSGGRANMDVQHNITGGLGVIQWAGRPSGYDPRSTYTRFSGQPRGVVDLFMKFYNGLQEQTTQP